MTRAALLLLAAAGTTTIVAGCSDSVAPQGCPSATTSVGATVSGGSSPSFDWQPRCAVALLLVEDQNGGDQWVVGTPAATWSDPTAANRIVPPVRYGVRPSGTEESEAPATLAAGQPYNLVLWRVIPTGASAAGCRQSYQGMCLLAVQPFNP